MLRTTVRKLATLGLVTVSVAVIGVAGARAATAGNGGTKPTIVLVHGAFAESAGWEGVITRLERRGYPVIAPANPLRGLAADATYLRKLLDTVKGPVVLAGHSYGGAVITNAAAGDPDVKALVYVAAFAPAEGETAAELAGKFPGSSLGETLAPVALGDGTSDLYIRPGLFRKQFAADVPARQAALMAVTQRPIRDVALNEPSGKPAWKQIPSWFILAGADLNIPVKAQRYMAARAGSRKTVEVRGASHAIGVSRPGEVTDLITAAAARR